MYVHDSNMAVPEDGANLNNKKVCVVLILDLGVQCITAGCDTAIMPRIAYHNSL